MAMNKNLPNLLLSKSLDVGTMYLVSAFYDKDGKLVTKKIRDAFLDVEPEARQMLRLSEVNFIERDNQVLIIGDEALSVANIFKREVRRPLSAGIISPGELDAQEVLSVIIQELLGKPREKEEICFFSVPGNPIDKLDQDVIYHQNVFSKIIRNLGYKPVALNEAVAIIYSECAKEKFSGLAFSYGSGMVNCALVFRTMSGLEFSLARAGDWIDEQSAKAVGSTAARCCAIKEKEIDLMGFAVDDLYHRAKEAIIIYYKSLIKYSLANVAKQFKAIQDTFELPEPIPLVVSGGTTLAKGFIELFKIALEEEKDFPIKISEVRHASDPLTATAKGLLVKARSMYE